MWWDCNKKQKKSSINWNTSIRNVAYLCRAPCSMHPLENENCSPLKSIHYHINSVWPFRINVIHSDAFSAPLYGLIIFSTFQQFFFFLANKSVTMKIIECNNQLFVSRLLTMWMLKSIGIWSYFNRMICKTITYDIIWPNWMNAKSIKLSKKCFKLHTQTHTKTHTHTRNNKIFLQ